MLPQQLPELPSAVFRCVLVDPLSQGIGRLPAVVMEYRGYRIPEFPVGSDLFTYGANPEGVEIDIIWINSHHSASLAGRLKEPRGDRMHATGAFQASLIESWTRLQDNPRPFQKGRKLLAGIIHAKLPSPPLDNEAAIPVSENTGEPYTGVLPGVSL